MDAPKYRMTISRLTVNSLGIKLYDKVSAVLAELIANAYDADATRVSIRLPMGRYLARKGDNGVEDLGFTIEIRDDGMGIPANRVNDHYLKVGANRREDPERGPSTPRGRRTMGRKGIGKLAPFGICREIEVITAGGVPTERGYEVSDLIMRSEGVITETDEAYYPDPGPLDGTWAEKAGTTVILRDFSYKAVPDATTLHRQLSSRFGVERGDWAVDVTDVDGATPGGHFVVGELDVVTLEGAKIVVDDRPIPMPDGTYLPVTGYIAYAREPYKDDVMAGVRIYAHEKIFAQTRDFNIPAGFHGEFKLRSYLVGAIRADWLDEDEDLSRSDRQDIIWESEKGTALREWGQSLVRELASQAETGLKAKAWDEYKERSNFDERVKRAAPSVRGEVTRAARMLVAGSDRESLRDSEHVERLTQLAFTIAPHTTLLNALSRAADEGVNSVGVVLSLFEQARLAEMYSLGQVANERVQAVERLEALVRRADTREEELQKLVEQSTWILAPDWTPLTENKSLATVRNAFEAWYEKHSGAELVTSAIDHPGKRPDFVLLNLRGYLEIVEIKRPDHAITDEEFDRAIRYLEALETFKQSHEEITGQFRGCRLTLVCDDLDSLRYPYRQLIDTDDRLNSRNWEEVLASTKQAHQDFLAALETFRETEASGGPVVEEAEPQIT